MCVVVSYLQYETVKLQAASEQEIYVYKKKKANKKHKEPGYLLHPEWAFYP